jgi:predicted nucleotidyltransferase
MSYNYRMQDGNKTFLNKFIKLTLSEEDWYKNIKGSIKAIIFYGSRAKGTNREDSDYDILIILPLKTEQKFTKGEYFYDLEGQKLNIVVRSIERLRSIAKDKTDQFQKEVFRKSIIIYENDLEVRSLLEEISRIKAS